MQLAAGLSSISIDRFPHPTDPDKFLLCDSAGQVYIVLCPLTEVYNAVLHECRAPAPVQDTTVGNDFTLLPTYPTPHTHITAKKFC